MKRITTLLTAIICTASLFAQTSKLPVIKEITSISNENTGRTVSIVNIPVDNVNHYWLDAGNMGIGDKVVQVEVEHIYRLYIPLGDNVTDALKTMEGLKSLYKEPKGTMREIQGSFKPFLPGEGLETVQVYRHQPLLTNQLQFVIERDGYDRVAYLDKSDFNSLFSGLKFHGKLYPNEM
ncbi:MAG: hypothetical protein J5737_00320 [Bacteroidales bacterium]|nr:hypothetical protein [Bacteroidales bacterium]